MSTTTNKLVSPISRLPVETLQDIFVQSIPPALPHLRLNGFDSSDTEFPFPEPDPAEPPLLLTQVCTLWRDVSTSTSELWCSIRLCLPDYDSYKGKGELLRVALDAWLRNARSQPLNIILNTPGRPFTTTSPPARGSLWDYILPVFISRASHWSTLVASPAIAKYLLERRIHMPILSLFSSQRLVYFRSTDVLRLFPRISSLSVTTIDDRWLLPDSVAQGLQHLSLFSCDSASDVLAILAYFPRLVSFRLRTCWSGESGSKTVSHQTLEELAIPYMVALPCVMNLLTLPSLRTMTVTGNWNYLEFGGSAYSYMDDQMEHEVQQLSRFSSRIRVCHADF